jgi:nucleoside phosphorylase
MNEIINIKDTPQLLAVFADIHIGVVTALQSELDALIRLAKHHERISYYRTYHKLTFKHNESEFVIVAHSLGHMGIAPMAISLMETLNIFTSLKYLAVVGIAAGSDSNNQDFGDLLIPETVYNYESGKYTEVKQFFGIFPNKILFDSDKKSYDIDMDIIQKIKAVTGNQSLLDSIQNEWPQKKSYKLKTHYGNFACGSVVVASNLKIKEIEKAIARKYIGLDMETFALAAINQIRVEKIPKLFIIKAITDFADNDKGDSEHEYAKYTSSRLFIAVCGEVLIK